MRFKRNKVWVALDERGQPRVDKGKVLIKYQLDQEHQYWVHRESVRPLDEAQPDSNSQASTPRGCPDSISGPTDPSGPDAQPEAIQIYTDGACSGNPGPSGIGAVLQYKRHQKEISRSIGLATNNIAELAAVKAALEAVKNRTLPVVVYTDSSYVLGLLARGWKAKQNQELVEEIRQLTRRFKHLRFAKVKGHAGHPGNERADQLAVKAIERSG